MRYVIVTVTTSKNLNKQKMMETNCNLTLKVIIPQGKRERKERHSEELQKPPENS